MLPTRVINGKLAFHYLVCIHFSCEGVDINVAPDDACMVYDIARRAASLPCDSLLSVSLSSKAFISVVA